MNVALFLFSKLLFQTREGYFGVAIHYLDGFKIFVANVRILNLIYTTELRASVLQMDHKASDSPRQRRKEKYFEDIIAPLSVDIGGSFTKIVYWRPQNPPNLPDYIIKEFQDAEEPFPLRPDPALKIHLKGISLLFGPTLLKNLTRKNNRSMGV